MQQNGHRQLYSVYGILYYRIIIIIILLLWLAKLILQLIIYIYSKAV